MNRTVLILVATLALTSFAVARKNDHGVDPAQGTANQAKAALVQITKGPIIEQVTDHSATIAWSTNVRGSSVIRYGTQPGNLGQTAEVPYGGLTHRVHLNNLNPSTKYYFVVDSGQGKGTGTEATSQELSFMTVAKGQKQERYPNPGPGE